MKSIDFISQNGKNYPAEDLFLQTHPYFIEDGFLQVLSDFNFKRFHQKIQSLSSIPSGVGLALGIIAEVNISGGILLQAHANGSTLAGQKLEEIQSGQSIFATGVSETGWQGRLRTITTEITENLLVNGSKSFLTNGLHASHFIIIAKKNGQPTAIIIDKNRKGIRIEKVTTKFTPQATHCKLDLTEVAISQQEILPIDYEKLALKLRMSELLSFSAIYCGFMQYLLDELIKKHHYRLRKEKLSTKKLFSVYNMIQLLSSHVAVLSGKKNQQPFFDLTPWFPFGNEVIKQQTFPLLYEVFSEEEVKNISDDYLLFELNDPLQESLLRKAYRKLF